MLAPPSWQGIRPQHEYLPHDFERVIVSRRRILRSKSGEYYRETGIYTRVPAQDEKQMVISFYYQYDVGSNIHIMLVLGFYV